VARTLKPRLPGFLKIKIRPLGSHRNAFASPSRRLRSQPGAQGGWWAQHCEHRPWSLASRPMQSLSLGLSNAHLRSLSLPSLFGACLPNFSTDPYTVAWEGRSRELRARRTARKKFGRRVSGRVQGASIIWSARAFIVAAFAWGLL
jgi:hypothetical protein